ncbi:MAG: hypothetical protein GX434_12645 [Peptococcaceae bacterium]|nr:hypothetical protein [Peptococcaceae bacterium]
MKQQSKWTLFIGGAIVILGVLVFIVSEKNGYGPAGLSLSSPTDSQLNSIQPATAFIPGSKFSPEGLTVKDTTFVCDSGKADLNGDGQADQVILVGEREDNSPFVQNIQVALQDASTGKFSIISVGESNVGYEPKLFIGRFTGLHNKDILISFATGGSGGVTQYSLLTYKDNQLTSAIPQEILNKGLELDTKCLPDFNLKVTDKNTGYTATIDLHQGKSDYERLGIYNQNGNLLAKDPLVLVDGFGVLNPEMNENGIYQLKGIQRISVGYHANSVANVESTWTVINGQLKLLSENVQPL